MDSKTEARIRTLIRKYLGDTCTPEELEELFTYNSSYPENTLWSEAIDEEAKHIHGEEPVVPIDVERKLRSSILNQIKKKDREPVRKLYLLRIAASLLVIATCVSLWISVSNRVNEIVMRTSFGEIRSIILPDSSVVILNSNSLLKYKKNWNNRDVREVYVQGEAFFKVTHKSNNQKFQVYTSTHVKINVLGTEFNVNDRRQRTQVTLHSGKIKLDLNEFKTTDSASNIIMKPGDYILVEDSRKVIKKVVDSQIYTSWKSKQFIFKETPLKEILYALEDNYGVTVIVNDSTMLSETFTATYPADNKEILLKALAKSFGIKYDSVNNTMTIKQKSEALPETIND
jgi:transmembrane sensor